MLMPSPTLATVLLDPPTALLAGAVLALVSSKLIALQPEREALRTTWLGAAWGVFYAGCVGWLFFTEPDWMLAYLKDAREVSLLPAFIVFAALCAAHGAFGALAVSAFIARGRLMLGVALTVAAVAVVGAVFWLQWQQYFVIGTFEAYYRGDAVPLQNDAVTQMKMNVAGGLTAVGSIAVIAWRIVQTKRLGKQAGAPSATA